MPAETWSTVTTVTTGENTDDRVFTVGIAEDPQGIGAYLILQTSLDEPTDQDNATGMDSYCVMDDEGGVCYGGILYTELRESELVMRFSTEASEELSVSGGELRLRLQVSDDDVAQLRSGLQRILSNGNPNQHPSLVGL